MIKRYLSCWFCFILLAFSQAAFAFDPPVVSGGSISPTSGNSGDIFAFTCNFDDPGTFVVDVRVRYKRQGSSSWSSETVLDWSGSGLSFNKSFSVSGAGGTYDFECSGKGASPDVNTIVTTGDWSQQGTFTLASTTGGLQGYIEPAEARSAGAQFEVIPWHGTLGWYDHGDEVTGLSEDDVQIKFKDISGWNTPADQTISIVPGDTKTFTGTYTPIASSGNPDLIIQSLDTSASTINAGESVTISATIKNQGDGESESTKVRYFLSEDSSITTSDTELSTDTLLALDAGESDTESDSNVLNTEGSFYLGACVDSASGESDSDNNCSSGIAITVNAAPVADATAPIYQSGSITPSTAPIGSEFTFTTEWSDSDDPYIVNVRTRYRIQGTTDWTEQTLAHAGTSGSSEQFTGTATISDEGTYEYQFRADASKTASATGTSSDWSSTKTFIVTVGTPGQVALTITKAGEGTVVSTPAGVDCGSDCSESYDPDTSVTLKATPGAGYTFGGWTGSDSCLGNGDCTVTLSANSTIQANFTEVPVTDATAPIYQSGSITPGTAPSGSEFTFTTEWSDSDDPYIVNVRARYRIEGTTDWTEQTLAHAGTSGSNEQFTGTATISDEGTYEYQFRADASKTASATGTSSDWSSTKTFIITAGTPGQVVLSITKTGEGTVTSTPAGIDCGSDCSESYDPDTSVTLKATPSTGYTFGGWTGSDSCLGNGDCTVTLTSSSTIRATFIEAPANQHSVSVSASGQGTGTITSIPTGINCPPTCTATFDENSDVKLQVSEGEESVFLTWSDDCSFRNGLYNCTLTIDGDKTASASFGSTNQAPEMTSNTVDPDVTQTGEVTLESIWSDPESNYIVNVEARVRKESLVHEHEWETFILNHIEGTSPPVFRSENITVAISQALGDGYYEVEYRASDTREVGENESILHTTEWEQGTGFTADNPPLLAIVETSNSPVLPGQEYSVTLNLTGLNLDRIEFDWNDGTPVEVKSTVGGGKFTFSRTFSAQKCGTNIVWSSTAYKKNGTKSNQEEGSFFVPEKEGVFVEFLEDIGEGQDHDLISSNTPFTKTWKFKNCGSETLTEDYFLKYVSGETFGANSKININQTVAPGKEFLIPVNMTTPEKVGYYESYWDLHTPAGISLEAAWAKIRVANHISDFPETSILKSTEQNKFATSSNAFDVTGNNLNGQCTWYVYGRVQELVESNHLPKSAGDKLYKAFWGTSGRHARNWPDLLNKPDWMVTSSTTALPLEERKAGLLVVWPDRNVNPSIECQSPDWKYCGHVAFVEKVTPDKKSYTVSEFNISPLRWGERTFDFDGTSDYQNNSYPMFLDLSDENWLASLIPDDLYEKGKEVLENQRDAYSNAIAVNQAENDILANSRDEAKNTIQSIYNRYNQIISQELVSDETGIAPNDPRTYLNGDPNKPVIDGGAEVSKWKSDFTVYDPTTGGNQVVTYTTHVQYGTEGSGNYPASVWIEYDIGGIPLPSGEKRVTNAFRVLNYKHKEFVKEQLQVALKLSVEDKFKELPVSIVDAISRLGENNPDFREGVKEGIEKAGRELTIEVANDVVDTADDITTFVDNSIDSAQTFFQETAAAIGATTWQDVDNAIQAAGATLLDIHQDIEKAREELTDKVVDLINNPEDIIEGLENTYQDIENELRDIADATGEKYEDVKTASQIILHKAELIMNTLPRAIHDWPDKERGIFYGYVLTHLAYEFFPASKALKALKLTNLSKITKIPSWLSKSYLVIQGNIIGKAIPKNVIDQLDDENLEFLYNYNDRRYYKDSSGNIKEIPFDELPDEDKELFDILSSGKVDGDACDLNISSANPFLRFVRFFFPSAHANTCSITVNNKVKTLRKNYYTGKAAESILKEDRDLIDKYGAASDKTSYKTLGTVDEPGKWRFFDIVFGDTAVESKVGRVSATKFIKKQVDKDIEALVDGNSNIDKIVWISTASPNTSSTNNIGFTLGFKRYIKEKLLEKGEISKIDANGNEKSEEILFEEMREFFDYQESPISASQLTQKANELTPKS